MSNRFIILPLLTRLAGKVLGVLSVAAFAFCIAGGTRASAQVTFTETFETAGSNVGGWSWGSGYEQFVESNGNPGRYLRDSRLSTFTPRASMSFGVESAFTGDYYTQNVASLGIDMAIAYADTFVEGRTVTLILLNDNGTPEDLYDDWGAFTVTSLPIPPTGIAGIIGETDILQWIEYDIDVPSRSHTLPEGWSWVSRNQVRRSGSWGRLMRDVDHVGFILGDPVLRYPLVRWDVALDNPRITTLETN